MELSRAVLKLMRVIHAIESVDSELANCIKQQHIMVFLSNSDDFDLESFDMSDQGAAAIAMGLIMYYCPELFMDDNDESL